MVYKHLYFQSSLIHFESVSLSLFPLRPSFTLRLTLPANYPTYCTLSFPVKLSLVCLYSGFSFLFQLLQPLHDPSVLASTHHVCQPDASFGFSATPCFKCFRSPNLFYRIMFPSICPEFPNFQISTSCLCC
jgi:hypothetical protein